jgi:hypothetical protein
MTHAARLVALAFLVMLAVAAPLAWGQGSAPAPATPATPTTPAPSPGVTPGAAPAAGSGTGAFVVAAVAIALIVILGLVAKLYDRKGKREAEAVALQARLSDLMLTDRSLHGGSVTPTVHASLWGRRMVIEVAGEVPSPEVRDLVMRKVRQEAQSIGQDIEIEDKLMVMPSVARPSAA